MTKYILEEGINFYEELYKGLDDNNEIVYSNDNASNVHCLISGEPLGDFHFTTECNHKFNYIPLYKDLLNFKNKLSFMENIKLKPNEIRCPYCRKKQTKLLPFYEELGLAKVNGINSWNPEIEKTHHNTGYKAASIWTTGTCCVPKCNSTSVKLNIQDSKLYCYTHSKEFLKLTVHGFTSGKCIQLLKSGPRKGSECGGVAYTNTNGCCKRHIKSTIVNKIVSVTDAAININENVIVG
jgi:hypothetical protein